MLTTLGDDTVPLRSAAASEPLSKMLLDGHYYFVDNAHHMTLGADVRVQNLVLGLLKGDFCTNQTALPPGNPTAAALAGVTGIAPDAADADYATLGTTTGVQLTLLGDARMTITDALGRRLAGNTGLLTGYANTIPGANLVEVAGAQVAALTTGGPFTVTIQGSAADGSARLKVENLRSGSIVRTLAFPGLPMTTTTTAALTLPSASVEPGTVLTYRYTPDSPAQELTTAPLDGGQAGDVTPPTVQRRVRPGDGAGDDHGRRRRDGFGSDAGALQQRDAAQAFRAVQSSRSPGRPARAVRHRRRSGSRRQHGRRAGLPDVAADAGTVRGVVATLKKRGLESCRATVKKPVRGAETTAPSPHDEGAVLSTSIAAYLIGQ